MILSNRTQASIIAALLRGDQPDFNPSDLTGAYREYYAWYSDLQGIQQPGGLWHHFLATYARKDEHFTACQLIGALHDEPLHYPSVDGTLDQLPDLRWLWHPWIARGQITLLTGDPSAGKSYLSLDLARRIAADTTWPDGTPVGQPGVTLYVDAENRPSVLKIRVSNWTDAQRQRLYYMLPAPNLMMIDLEGDLDRERFLDRVYRLRPALIIIDSYGSISLKGENNKEDVQRILSFLTRVSRDYDCAVVIIHHLRKRSRIQLTLPQMPRISIHSVRGSGHIGAMATNILGLQLVGTDQNGVRSLHVVKNNLGIAPEPIGVTFIPWSENPEVAVISYGDVPEPDHDLTKVEQCMEWLVELLEDGALSPSEIIDLAEYEDYNRRMVFRARNKLGAAIVDTEGPKHPSNRWTLSEDTECTEQ